MSKDKPTPGGRSKKKTAVSLVRSSAAEYLTFLAASGEGGVEAVYADENVWLSQKMMGTLYDENVRTVNEHLKKIFADSELHEDSVIRKFRITAADGKNYNTLHYKLSAIIAVGYKVNSERAVQFRKWAIGIIESFTIKGFAMDDERLKNDGAILGKKYFEEQLQRIREIRLSERKFYQKITDIYATALDYDVTAQVTKRFFATVQNKLHWAIHGQTAAEVIVDRADAEKMNMGLTTWKDAPRGKIQKFDVSIAKNYLSDSELASWRNSLRHMDAVLDDAEIPHDTGVAIEFNIPQTSKRILRELTGTLKKSRISNLFVGSGAFTATPSNTFGGLIVDEAHRLNEKSGLFSNLGENQIKELIDASTFTVFFLDEDQRIHWKDIGEKYQIRDWAESLGATVTEMDLVSQFRCNGSDGYLAWVDRVLQVRETSLPILGSDYSQKISDSGRPKMTTRTFLIPTFHHKLWATAA